MALTKYNYNSFDVTPVASKAMGFNSGANGLTTVTEGSMVLIKTLTASSSATISFVDGTSDVVLDNTYPTYLFKFVNAHPETNSVELQFNGSSDTGSNYNVAKTTTAFQAYQNEAGTATSLMYEPSQDIAQGTGFQGFFSYVGNDNDQAASGELWLFNPSSTTFVKHFISVCNVAEQGDVTKHCFRGGYFNTTSVIDAIQFKMSSDAIDAGTFKLYGIKDS